MSVELLGDSEESAASDSLGQAAGTSTAIANSRRPKPAPMTAASRALLYGEDDDDDAPLTPEEMAAVEAGSQGRAKSKKLLVTSLLAIALIGLLGAVGWWLWRTYDPLNQNDRLPLPEESPALPEGS
jgi:hypothetical protein